MSDLWGQAYDSLNDAVQAATRDGGMTTDQKFQQAQVEALLSISQELSKIHHEGINPTYEPHD